MVKNDMYFYDLKKKKYSNNMYNNLIVIILYSEFFLKVDVYLLT